MLHAAIVNSLHLACAGARIRAPECVPLQVSRLLEERVADAEGIRDVRHWLSLIGAVQTMQAAASAAHFTYTLYEI